MKIFSRGAAALLCLACFFTVIAAQDCAREDAPAEDITSGDITFGEAVTSSDLAPPAVTEADVTTEEMIESENDAVWYCDDLEWYSNDEITELGFAETYIDASAKRSDPKYAQLRDPEIYLIRLTGENGGKTVNEAIQKDIAEPYSSFISQIESNNYTSDTLFVCHSYVLYYEDIAVIEISYFIYDGLVATEAGGVRKIYYYDYVSDRALTASDVLSSAGIAEDAFIGALNAHLQKFGREAEFESLSDLEFILPTETGITVYAKLEKFSDYAEMFTVPYESLK